MIEVYLVWALIGFGVFLISAHVAVVRLPRLASPERQANVKLVATVVFGGLLIAGIIWAPAVTSSARGEAEELLAAYCEKSGDEIFRTVENVEGLLIDPPPAGDVRANHFHTGETTRFSYINPPERKYRYLEIASSKPGAPIRRLDSSAPGGRADNLDSPTARYALTWMDTTRIQEGNAGLFGEQVLIYDRLTGEVLARRTHHYLVERSGPRQRSETIHTCENVNIGSDTIYADRRPRSSYLFVSQVLIPAEQLRDSQPKNYVLNKGSGFLMMDCGPNGVHLSEDISKQNLLVRREGVDLYLDRTDAPDRLICTHFFDEGRKPAPEKRLRLFDGTELPWSEVLP